MFNTTVPEFCDADRRSIRVRRQEEGVRTAQRLNVRL